MITEEKIKKLPQWIKHVLFSLQRGKIPAKVIYILISVLATIWFLIRVIPKPSRAYYPCMQTIAPVMSGFVVWILSLTGATLAFKKAKHKLFEAQYVAAGLLLFSGITCTYIFSIQYANDLKAEPLKVWYKPNVPLGEGKGIHPGRVAWGHNPKAAYWDQVNGFWWEDKFNNQAETDQLFVQTITGLTGKKDEGKSWELLFRFFNKTKRTTDKGYQRGEKVAIKINQNNTSSHENTNEINANPQLILSLLKSLVYKAGVPQQFITVSDPSRFITDNIYDKCYAVFPRVHFVEHDGGEGREQASFVENAIPYSVDNGRVARGLATCFLEADYIINMALMKGHVSQGVTLCAKNFFGCTSIETDWRKNAHSVGFSQDRGGKHTYSVYPDYMGHKDLGGKTMLFLVDGIYGHKFVNGIPNAPWALSPFNNHWPCSLFASQDGVAIDAVVLDFALAEWPDASDMMYSDYSLNESALAYNPPSGTFYDPERDGIGLKSLGVSEHWNNPFDKKYSRNLGKRKGVELKYIKVD